MTIKRWLHKVFFPKEDSALQVALDISHTYATKSPDPIKREVGEDIYIHVSRHLSN